MSVALSIIGVPVIPMVFGISPHIVSDEAKGGSRVLLDMRLPVIPSITRTMF